MQALRQIWQEAGLSPAALGAMQFTGQEPALPSAFAVSTLARATIGACALAAATLHERRGGPAQQVTVNLRHAALAFRSERHLRIDGKPAPELWDELAGLYPTSDGFVRLHTNFPHHRAGVLKLLGCAPHRAGVAQALLDWQAAAFEQAAAEAGMVVAAARSFAEWDAHPQARALAPQPPLIIEKIGEASPRHLPPAGAQPLAGVRVLDLTRVIAGPVAGRTLAAHGAEVLHISAPHLPSMAPLVMDTGRGKRSAALDLRDADARARLEGLVRGADVFLQGYRPGALAGHGFAPEAVAAMRPGIVYLQLSAYGHRGPWAGRRGFDSLVQTATGLNHAEAEAFGEARPRPLPCQALDHASGYLLAFGALAAMLRQAEQGGSWLVRVSLAATGQWLRSLGPVPGGPQAPEMPHESIGELLEESESGFGRMTAVRHPAMLPLTPAGWALPSVPLGAHLATWHGDAAFA